MNRVAILGTGGQARDLGDIAWALDLRPLYVAHSAAELAAWAFDDEAIAEGDAARWRELPCVIGIGDPSVRQAVARRNAGKLRFRNLLHPDASFGRGQRDAIDAGQGIAVCAGVRFSSNVRVGDFAIFNANATIGHDCVIGEFALVAPGALVSGNVAVGARCWIGSGAVINQGASTDAQLSIGEGTIIGSGAVVVRDCDAGATYVGVPARRTK